MAREVAFYVKEDEGVFVCQVCPHNCHLKEGMSGVCRVRKVENNSFGAINYGEVSSLGIDPIEKKPLYHYKPGTQILSAGSFGCNFTCGFCQNYSIAKNVPMTRFMEPEEIIRTALETKGEGNVGLAFTYNEPFMWYEYVYDTARKCRDKEIDIVLVTNGYINKMPLEELLPYVDAMNIDLKGFTNEFYKDSCKGDLDNVLSTIEVASSECHVEITTLLVNGYNDSYEEVEKLAKWIASVDGSIPLHLSRYYPSFKFTAPPTPVDRILECREIAEKYLDYVYVGNVMGVDNNTHCPKCREMLVEREGYKTKLLINEARCPRCKADINIVIK
jgi:pyruvate formate lyase activating enzyme